MGYSNVARVTFHDLDSCSSTDSKTLAETKTIQGENEGGSITFIQSYLE